MEKPEWFETVDALDSAPESVAPLSASARTSRFAKAFTAVGAAVLIASGGYAFGQSNIGPSSSQALSSTSATPQAGAATSTAAQASTAQTQSAPASASAAAPTLAGGRPSIAGGGPAGEDGND
jgi:hypothetical protein